MGILLWIIGGALVGWIASMIAGTNSEQGAVGNIIIGILGAFLGGFIVNALNGDNGGGITGFNLSSFLVALLGAVILSFLYRMLRRNTHTSPTMHS
jgi:uncharacterized membrane protein YeaQ/YmgE (transglycosylase-associated protein family)